MILQKLAAAAQAIGPIAKTGKNPEEGYAYVEAAPVIAAAKAALHAQGLVIVPSVREVAAEPLPERKYARLTSVRVAYFIHDIASGERLDVEWAGQGFDAGDKGANKAYTACLKYMLINLLLIPIGDDPEADGVTVRDVRRAERKSEAEIKASVERPGPTWAPSPPKQDPWAHERELYDVRCRRLGMSGRGSSAARARVIEEVCGEKIARKNLTLVQYQAVNDELNRRLLAKLEAGAQRTDSPAEAVQGTQDPTVTAAPEVPEEVMPNDTGRNVNEAETVDGDSAHTVTGDGASEEHAEQVEANRSISDAVDEAIRSMESAAVGSRIAEQTTALDQAFDEAAAPKEITVEAAEGPSDETATEWDEWPPKT